MKRVLLALALAACVPQPVGPMPDADASSDAAPDPFGTYDCTSWCKHAAQLGCNAAALTKNGASCVDVCVNVQSGPAKFDVQCRTLASSCQAADACESKARALEVVDASPDAMVADTDAVLDAMPVTCASWCKHAADLKCKAGRPTPAKASCTDVCTNVQSGPAKFNLKCRITAKTCATADACEKN